MFDYTVRQNSACLPSETPSFQNSLSSCFSFL